MWVISVAIDPLSRSHHLIVRFHWIHSLTLTGSSLLTECYSIFVRLVFMHRKFALSFCSAFTIASIRLPKLSSDYICLTRLLVLNNNFSGTSKSNTKPMAKLKDFLFCIPFLYCQRLSVFMCFSMSLQSGNAIVAFTSLSSLSFSVIRSLVACLLLFLFDFEWDAVSWICTLLFRQRNDDELENDKDHEIQKCSNEDTEFQAFKYETDNKPCVCVRARALLLFFLFCRLLRTANHTHIWIIFEWILSQMCSVPCDNEKQGTEPLQHTRTQRKTNETGQIWRLNLMH